MVVDKVLCVCVKDVCVVCGGGGGGGGGKGGGGGIQNQKQEPHTKMWAKICY